MLTVRSKGCELSIVEILPCCLVRSSRSLSHCLFPHARIPRSGMSMGSITHLKMIPFIGLREIFDINNLDEDLMHIGILRFVKN